MALQAIHQHTAPAVDLNAQRLLDDVPGAPPHADLVALERAANAIAKAIREATWRRADHVGTGWSGVDRVASNRRIPQPDGTVLARLSSTKDPVQRSAPEGNVDGYVRTVSFMEGEAAVAQLHYYATHPQSYFRDGRVSYDVPGMARERLEEKTGVHQVYFTGCGGDVAMGKYNDDTPTARAQLARRLYEGMRRSAAAPAMRAVEPIAWRTRLLHLRPRHEPAFSQEANRKVLRDEAASATQRVMAAMVLAFQERVRDERPFELSCMSIGPVKLVHLPGEPFIAYQFHAQACRPDRFVAVAGYGDCAMWYIPTEKAFTESGGYETSWAFAQPCERELRRAIEDVMADT